MSSSGTTESKREIVQVSAALLSAVNGSNVDDVLAVWRTDGTLMPPHHAAVHGHAELRAYFADLFARRRMTFTFTASNVHVAGDIAFERLSFHAISTPVAGGESLEDVGKGLHVFARESDGTWKLVLDIWNSDRAIEAASKTETE
jgi:ketosteroid isomerase-like protein